MHVVYGLSGAKLEHGVQITTPWGVIMGAPQPRPTAVNFGSVPGQPTTAVLVSPRLSNVVISNEPNPESTGSSGEYFANAQRVQDLVPLAFALATTANNRCAPIVTFSTEIFPFSSGFGASSPIRPWVMRTDVIISQAHVAAIEEWARRLGTGHVEALRVATRRIVSAIAERSDKSDALIDAITAWESLVGTRGESVFRVTASLAKLLQDNALERRAVRSQLGKTYDVRSRVVHGEVLDQTTIATSANQAIDVALAAIRALYERGGAWLSYSSQERADRLILEE